MTDDDQSSITEDDIFGGSNEIQVGNTFTIPHGMSLIEARDKITDEIRSQVEPTEFSRQFDCRPDDGAYNAMQELEERFGLVFGTSRETMFGDMPPRMRRIQVSLTETTDIPDGSMQISSLPGVTIRFCDDHYHGDYGQIFTIHVTAPARHNDLINEFFDAVEERITANSIYRGKAVRGVNRLKFVDLHHASPNLVVHATDTRALIETSLWGPLRLREQMKRDGLSLKRAVMLYGDYGTGKTLTGRATAKIAVDHGWTVIIARPDEDDLLDAIQLGRMYMPAMVFVEDVDAETSTGDDSQVKRMLDLFDGFETKSAELMVVVTTNHLKRVHKAMLRPGRLDAIIEIGKQDRDGLQKLVKLYTPESRLGEVDYQEVYDSAAEFTPAFIREAINRAMIGALSRAGGTTDYKISTEDLVLAAKSLEQQYQIMAKAGEGEKPPSIEAALVHTVGAAVDGAKVVSTYGDTQYVISSNGHS